MKTFSTEGDTCNRFKMVKNTAYSRKCNTGVRAVMNDVSKIARVMKRGQIIRCSASPTVNGQTCVLKTSLPWRGGIICNRQIWT